MKTVRSFSRRGVLLAAAFLTALSLDPGLHAQGTGSPAEVVCPANLFLPPTGTYLKSAGSTEVVWSNGVQCRAFKFRARFPLISNAITLPPPGAQPVELSVPCTADLELSNNSGATYQPVTLSADATMRISPGSVPGVYDTEMLALTLTGPGPLRIRESPTKQSLGQHTVRAVPDGSFRVGSFFDIFTEISLDGGQNWSPTPGAAPALHCVLAEPGECAAATSSLPPVECVIAAQTDIVFANGVVLRELRLREPGTSLPPPAVGASQVVSFTTHASGRISLNGGGTFIGWEGDCAGTCLYSGRVDAAGVRFFDTEMLSLSLAGGSLPAGTMIRESPTKQSLGRTSLRLTQSGASSIGSFFDVFTELSLDGGQNWSPSTASACACLGEPASLQPVVYLWPTDEPLPPATYGAVGPKALGLSFKGSNFRAKALSLTMLPGGFVSSAPLGTHHQKRCEAEVQVSVDGGVSYALVHADVEAGFDVGTSTADGDRPIECVSFTVTNTGTVPTGVLLRESPTRPSLGQIRASIKQGHYAVSNFVDVSFEVSTDSGATWFPADDPLRLMLAPTVPVDTYASDFFPPRDGAFSQDMRPYFRPYNGVTRYGGSSVRVTRLRFRIVDITGPPPVAAGAEQIRSGAYEVECDLSLDGGVSIVPVKTTATGTMRVKRNNGTSVARFETEMLALNVSGGGLPPGVMFRESPTKQSLGELRESPTLPSTGKQRISSFFDVFTEISLDAGQTWLPGDEATHLELHRDVPAVFSSSDWLPLAGVMECDEDGGSVAFGSDAIMRVNATFSDGLSDRTPPPALADVTKISAITMRLKLSLDGGLTFTDATASGTQTVRTSAGSIGTDGKTTHPTELLALEVTLPTGTMIRESPTKQSGGQTNKRPVPGGYRIESFFDVFTELSLDGGATWKPCDQPVHLERVTSGQPQVVADNLLPPRGSLVSAPGGLTLRCVTGEHLKDVQLSPIGSAGRIQPPPPGATVSTSQNFEFTCLYSDDDGVTYRKSGAVIACDYEFKELSRRPGVIEYQGEITALHMTGGTFPAGTMIRESPTKQSLGKTVSRTLPDGSFSVSSFFDVFLDLSTDGGATYKQVDFFLEIELDDEEKYSVVSTDSFPPPGDYTQPFTATGTFSDMSSARRVKVRFPTLPDSSLPALGSTASFPLTGTAECVLQPAGSPSVIVTCPLQAELSVTHSYTDAATRFFDVEILSMNLSGGTLPPGCMIRESPTLQSTGKHTVRAVAGGYRVSSFFDVFMEVSLDGGASWSPSDGPVHLDFALPPTPPIVAIEAVTGLTYSGVTLHGTVNPQGKPTTAQFAILLDSTLTNFGVPLLPNDGSTAQPVSIALTGLNSASTYHGTLSATNADGTTTSSDLVFTTPDTPIRLWKLAYLGNADAPDLGTPDNDGITNLAKYSILLLPGSSGVASLPEPQLLNYTDGQRLALVFLRDPQRSDVTISVLFATSLYGPWTTVATSSGGAPFTGPGLVSENDVVSAPGIKRVEVRDPSPSATINFTKVTFQHNLDKKD